MIDRRALLRSLGLAGGTFLLKPRRGEAAQHSMASMDPKIGSMDPKMGSMGSMEPAAPRHEAHAAHGPAVVTPDGTSLPFTMENGVKVFRLTAEPVKREFAPGLTVNCWGYHGQAPGPTIEAFEGDRVRFLVTNKLPEPTSVHWHGVLLPNGMDGVSGLNQPKIEPGETFQYEFTLRQHGTQMYHPHFDEMTQIALGMMGFFVIHPRRPRHPQEGPVDRDFCIFLNEWALRPGTATPDPTVMTDFNVFTFNGKVYPATAPLVARLGQRVRIRFANLSMDSHPMHLHGMHCRVTGTDAGLIPLSAQWPEATIDVPTGTTRDIEFVADNPGDWALHRHKTHHTMNQMGHGLPLMIGVDTAGVEERLRAVVPGTMTMGQDGMGEMMRMGAPRNSIPMLGGQGPSGAIDMGGMFTIVKVREGIATYGDPGWYTYPKGSQAHRVGEAAEPAMDMKMPEGHHHGGGK